MGYVFCEIKIHTFDLTELREVIDTLAGLGLINKENGVWRKTQNKMVFPTDKTHEGVRHYHKQMIGKALSTMVEQTTEEEVARRRILGITFASNPEYLDEAIQRLNEVLFEISSLMGQGECSEVYQFNLQLVPLTRKESEK